MGNGSVHKVFFIQAQGPKFALHNPHKKASHSKVRCSGVSLKSQYREDEERKIPVAHEPASLAYLSKLQIPEELLSQKPW